MIEIIACIFIGSIAGVITLARFIRWISPRRVVPESTSTYSDLFTF